MAVVYCATDDYRFLAGPRVERIDTHRNVLFTDCRSEWEVDEVYEAFWNRLNDSWETDFPAGKEKVKVVSVERVVRCPRRRSASLRAARDGDLKRAMLRLPGNQNSGLDNLLQAVGQQFVA